VEAGRAAVPDIDVSGHAPAGSTASGRLRGNTEFWLILVAGALGVVLAVFGLVSSRGTTAPAVQLPGIPGLPTGPGGLPQAPTDFPTGFPTGFPSSLPTRLGG
jgi:hypothetical protein